MLQRALIDIDMILDTRYGTLRRIDSAWADEFVKTDAYMNRSVDTFGEMSGGRIDQAEYDRLYAARDRETLANSVMTDFVYYLRKDVNDIYIDMVRGTGPESINLDINFWPYELEEEEMELIRRAVQRYIPLPATVGAVKIDPKFLTPQVVDNSYEMMAYYNHEDWLKHHLDALVGKPIPQNVLVTPRIATSGVVPEPTELAKDPFMVRSAFLVRHVALVYVPTRYACYNDAVITQIRNRGSRASARPEEPQAH